LKPMTNSADKQSSTNDLRNRIGWFVATTKPRREVVARQQLQNQGYTVYLPLFKGSKHQKGQWQDKSEVLFPSYLFIKLNLGRDNIAPIRSTIGMRDLVRFGNQLTPIPDSIIDFLQRNEQQQFSTDSKHTAQFKQGDVVNIVGGPFDGLEAAFKMPKSADRVIVLIAMLGSQQSVTVDVDSITSS
jgi:transcriptional antiterminator RfaH